ncbi:hypothetical protein M9H77_35014 [Catharanthus roseus]|uniref:Uncharacterized protein n=1 Tax=Catharanthus roseus TaxID=4058 RepID=A0ACB9ZMT8_CATRO|nr:hypothetical protein M9H77_35014 [Catharanthus roseus]
MSVEGPIKLYLFWDCEIRHDIYGNPYFHGSAMKTCTLDHRIQHHELVEKICTYRGLDKDTTRLKMTLRCPTVYSGCPYIQYTAVALKDDDDLEEMWNLPRQFKSSVHLHVELDSVPLSTTSLPTPTDDVGSFRIKEIVHCESSMIDGIVITEPVGPSSDIDGAPNPKGPNDHDFTGSNNDAGDIVDKDSGPTNELALTFDVRQASNTSNDYHALTCFQNMGSGEAVDDAVPCFQDTNPEDEFDYKWSESNSDLRLHMTFENKDQAIYAVRKWSIKEGREIKVMKSNKRLWTASCKNSSLTDRCYWYVRIIEKCTDGEWEITVWHSEHTCPVRVVSNKRKKLSHKNSSPESKGTLQDSNTTSLCEQQT